MLSIFQVLLVLGGDAVTILESLLDYLHRLPGVHQKPVVALLVLQVQHDASLAVANIVAIH